MLHRAGRSEYGGFLFEVGGAAEIKLAVVDDGGKRRDGHKTLIYFYIHVGCADVQPHITNLVETDFGLGVEVGEHLVGVFRGIFARETNRVLSFAFDSQARGHKGREHSRNRLPVVIELCGSLYGAVLPFDFLLDAGFYFYVRACNLGVVDGQCFCRRVHFGIKDDRDGILDKGLFAGGLYQQVGDFC